MAGSVENKRILISGASGFIGQHVVDALLRRSVSNDRIFCLTTQKRINSSLQWVVCDLSNYSQVESVLTTIKPHIVIHLAWYVKPNKFWTSKENIHWVFHTINLFENFIKNNGEIFINAGSIAEYDLSKELLENTLPNTLYGNSKFTLRRLLYSLKDVYKVSCKIIWPQIGWLFGENEPKEKLFSTIFNRLMFNQSIFLNRPNIELPYLHIKHVSNAIVECINCNSDCIFPLIATNTVSLENVVKEIALFLKKPYNIHYKEFPCIKKYVFKIDAIPNNIKKHLKADFKKDLKEFLNYIKLK